MLRYLFKRLWHTVFVIIGISLISFFFIHLSGDPVMLMLPADASHQEIEALRQQLGFNDPLAVQYFRFASRAVRGDFGDSLYYKVPVMELMLERLPASSLPWRRCSSPWWWRCPSGLFRRCGVAPCLT